MKAGAHTNKRGQRERQDQCEQEQVQHELGGKQEDKQGESKDG